MSNPIFSFHPFRIGAVVVHPRYMPHVAINSDGILSESFGTWNLRRFDGVKARASAVESLTTRWLLRHEVQLLVMGLPAARAGPGAMAGGIQRAAARLGVQVVTRPVTDTGQLLAPGSSVHHDDLVRLLAQWLYPELAVYLRAGFGRDPTVRAISTASMRVSDREPIN